MNINKIGIPNQINKIIESRIISKLSKEIPVVTEPLLAYYVGESQDKYREEIINFFKSKYLQIPDYLKPHPDTKTGLDFESQGKIQRALDKAFENGKITEEEYKKYKYKVTFTGNDGDNNPLNRISAYIRASGGCE